MYMYLNIHNVVSHLGKKNIMLENNRLRRGRRFSRSRVGYPFWLNPMHGPPAWKIFKRNSGQFTWQGNHHHFRLVHKHRIKHIYIVMRNMYIYMYVYIHIHPTHINPRTHTVESKYMEFQPLFFFTGAYTVKPILASSTA